MRIIRKQIITDLILLFLLAFLVVTFLIVVKIETQLQPHSGFDKELGEFHQSNYSNDSINKRISDIKLLSDHHKSTGQTSSRVKPPSKPNEGPFSCLKNPEKLPTLPNIKTRSPKIDKNVVLLKTSCIFGRKREVYLDAREACAVEAAALHNPDFEVHIIFTAPVDARNSNRSKENFLEPLQTYKNIIMSRIDIEDFFIGTPVERLYKSGLMEKSYWPYFHLSDVLRYLIIWRYGSIYLDLDVITLKSFEDIEPNFAGFMYFKPGAGAMGFQAQGKGHQWIEMMLRDLDKNFTKYVYYGNGIGILYRFLMKICNTTIERFYGLKTIKRCQGFHLYPSYVFYPMHFNTKEEFWDPKRTGQCFNQLKNSHTIHLYNTSSSKLPLKKGDHSTMELLFMKHCPQVYSNIDQHSIF